MVNSHAKGPEFCTRKDPKIQTGDAAERSLSVIRLKVLVFPIKSAGLTELFLDESGRGNVAMQLTPGRLDIVCQRLGWDGLGFQRAFDKAVKQLAARA